MDIKDSDSDISDGWSVVDAAAQSENENGSVKDVSDDNESVNCNVSDGESLEIIQEENDERKQFIESVSDIENDCFSVMSNCSSMIMEEAASDNIEWNANKLQTYVHRRNYLLNARLNLVVVVAVAAVVGLGVGHFIGSQEDCSALPSCIPDVSSVDSSNPAISKNPKLDFNPYFNQPFISPVLKAKGIEQIQQSYTFCARDDKVTEGKCFSGKQGPLADFVGQNQNCVIGAKTYTNKLPEACPDQDLKYDVHIEKQESLEINQESENSIDNFHSKVDVRILHDKHPDSEVGVNAKVSKLKDVNIKSITVHSVRDSESESSNQVSKDVTDEYKTDVDHGDEEVLINVAYSRKEPDQNLKKVVLLRQEVNMPQDDLVHNEESIFSKKDKVHQNIKDQTPDIVEPVKDAFDGSCSEVSSDCETSEHDEKINQNNNDQTPDIVEPVKDAFDGTCSEVSSDCETSEHNEKIVLAHDAHRKGDNDVSEEISLQDINSPHDHSATHHSEVPSESEKQIPEQLSWLQRFSDTILQLNTQGDSKLFPVVEMLAGLKQSIVELDQTILTNESSKLVKKMKMSVNKMKETMERIQREASSWSAKTTEKVRHRLLKLKSKVQEKWCDVKHQYQNQNANIFSWLKNNLFQDCRVDENTDTGFVGGKSVTKIFGKENCIKQSYPSTGNDKKDKSYNNDFDRTSNGKTKLEKHKRIPCKFETTDDCGHSESYGYARNTPDSASHDFRKSSKGAFDKLRHHNTKCPPNCKHENVKSNNMDSAEKWTLARKVAADWKDNSNASGIWMLRMSQGRAQSRMNDQKSDWLFERARARKMRRETDDERVNWFFERAEKRKNCRLNPQSDWCLGVKRSVQEQNKYTYDHFDNDDDDDDEDEDEDDKQHEYFRPKFWSRNIPSAPFAKTGKWLKNTVKEFKQKMNYYQYNQHKFHYV